MSTNVNLHEPTIEVQLQTLFGAARYERFEDGMESEFSKDLLNLIDRHGAVALNTLSDLLLSPHVSMEVAAEACRWLGHITNPQTQATRRQLLERVLLNSSSARARDGAGLGLASIDDPASIPALQQAIEQEQVEELRNDLQQVLDQLIETQRESA